VLHPVKLGDLAAAAQAAALDQDVIGSAAVVLIFSLSRPCIAAAGPYGTKSIFCYDLETPLSQP
jgi:hypothetical protein